eukprot:923896_1
MSPEVYARKEFNPQAADIWSLGVMLFMMLIGAPPYQLPTPTNPAFNFIINGRLRDVLKHWKRLRCVNKNALDLLNKIFKYESKRINMEQLLKHPFINLLSKKQINTNNTTNSTNNTFTTDIAKKFAKQLQNDNNREQLTVIMKEIEKTHNSMQQKVNNKSQETTRSNESKLQQTIKELELIKVNVQQRLNRFTINQQQTKHKVKRYTNETPHNN